MSEQPLVQPQLSPRSSGWQAAGHRQSQSSDAAVEALRQEYEMKIIAIRAEEKAKYEVQLEGVRNALESMYNQRLEAEVQRRLAIAGQAPITDATKVTDLIERLFGDRPKDKKQVWITAFEDNEITTVGVLRKLNPAGWQRLALPLGVEQALQDTIKDIGQPKPPAAPAPAPVAAPPQYAYAAPPVAAAAAPPPPAAGVQRLFQLPGQNPVYIDDAAGTARTMSGCPYKGCEKDFEFVYTAAGKQYTPKDCPNCKKSVKPPARLTEASKQVVAPAPPATYTPPPVVYAAPPPVAAVPPPAPGSAPPPAYAAPQPPAYAAPLPPGAAPAPPAAAPQLRCVEVAGQSPVMVDDINRTATTMSGCPYKGCEKDFEFKYVAATKSFTPVKCPFCGKSVKAPGRLTNVASTMK